MTDDISRRRYRLVFALLFTVHFGLCAYAFPSIVVFGGLPYGLPDYQTHYQQTSTLSELVRDHGRMWGYDPNLLAGVPVGLFFEVDNKAHFLFTYGLTAVGVSRPVAFNLFPLLSALLAPFSILLAARLFRLGRRAELFAFGLAALIWHFDSTTRHCWAGGMISWATVSHAALLVFALFYRLVAAALARQDPDRPAAEKRSLRFLLALGVGLPLVHLIHVWAFAVLVVPMAGLYALRFRRLDLRGHLEVWGLALSCLLISLIWLWPALSHWELLAPSGKVGQANPLYVLWDYFELLVNPVTTGFIAPHTFWRFVAFFAAAATLWRWHRAGGDPRLTASALALGWLLGITYLAALIPGLRETEPYRFIIPAALCAALLGGPALAAASRREVFAGLSPTAKGLLLVLLALLVPRAARDAFHFIPEARPRAHTTPIRPPADLDAPPRPVLPVAPAPPLFDPKTFRLLPVFPDLAKLALAVRELPEPGRVLVQLWPAGELLRWATTKPIVGGFPDRRLIHEAAYLFRDNPTDPRFWGQELADYLVRYNVRYLIVSDQGYEMVEARTDLLAPVKMIGAHRIYRVRHNASYFARGTGTVTARLNRIEVRDARPEPGTQLVELRFHHMKTLRCSPGCRVERAEIPHDPVGFIRVHGTPTLPSRFVIEHTY